MLPRRHRLASACPHVPDKSRNRQDQKRNGAAKILACNYLGRLTRRGPGPRQIHENGFHNREDGADKMNSRWGFFEYSRAIELECPIDQSENREWHRDRKPQIPRRNSVIWLSCRTGNCVLRILVLVKMIPMITKNTAAMLKSLAGERGQPIVPAGLSAAA